MVIRSMKREIEASDITSENIQHLHSLGGSAQLYFSIN